MFDIHESIRYILAVVGFAYLVYATLQIVEFRKFVSEDILWLNLHFGKNENNRFEAAYARIAWITICSVLGAALIVLSLRS